MSIRLKDENTSESKKSVQLQSHIVSGSLPAFTFKGKILFFLDQGGGQKHKWVSTVIEKEISCNRL